MYPQECFTSYSTLFEQNASSRMILPFRRTISTWKPYIVDSVSDLRLLSRMRSASGAELVGHVASFGVMTYLSSTLGHGTDILCVPWASRGAAMIYYTGDDIVRISFPPRSLSSPFVNHFFLLILT